MISPAPPFTSSAFFSSRAASTPTRTSLSVPSFHFSVSVETRRPWQAAFEDGGAVAFEVGLRAAQRGDAGVQARELLCDLRYDPALFGEWG